MWKWESLMCQWSREPLSSDSHSVFLNNRVYRGKGCNPISTPILCSKGVAHTYIFFSSRKNVLFKGLPVGNSYSLQLLLIIILAWATPGGVASRYLYNIHT